jgi:hypothetical protein
MECPVCGALPGSWHNKGCGWEQCPYCGEFAIDCACGPRIRPLDDRLRWIGACPWLTACLEYGFFEREVGGRWLPCSADALGSHPDVARLLRECWWSRDDKRFVRRQRAAA